MNFADVEMGEQYRDTLTGFVGTAVGRAEYLGGNQSVQLTRKGANDFPQDIWLHPLRLTADHDRQLGISK